MSLLDRAIPPDSVRRVVLPNGLRLLVRRDTTAPVVAIVTYVKAGYFDETDDIVGVAHVLKHMYFKGTPSLGVGEIARATKASGGFLNAGTIYDHTHYYAVLPSTGFAAGLAVQADAYANSLIDAAELARELEVIIEEAKRKLIAQKPLVKTYASEHYDQLLASGDVVLALYRDDQPYPPMPLKLLAGETCRSDLAALVAEGPARPGAYRLGDRTIRFAASESIRTDTSHKYAPDTFRALASAQGWEPVRLWVDEDSGFSVVIEEADAGRAVLRLPWSASLDTFRINHVMHGGAIASP